jgi:hypothetical protein
MVGNEAKCKERRIIEIIAETEMLKLIYLKRNMP